MASLVLADREEWPEVDLDDVSALERFRCLLGGHRLVVDTGTVDDDGRVFSCRCGKHAAGIDWM